MHSADSYRDMVARLEMLAVAQPRRYRIELAALALLGYLVLVGSLLLAIVLPLVVTLVLAFFKGWILLFKLAKILWIPLVLAWIVVKSLWVKIPPPTGRYLRKGEAPELEALVERLRQGTGAPALEAIVFDSAFNAGAVSVPRLLGLLGSRHYLMLGLPLLQALDRQELEAVIAHEFGHFGQGHSRFSGWIYRLRESWYRLLDAMSRQEAWGSGLYLRFFRWYAPYFNAYSFVLARSNEYDADAASVRAVGAPVMARALSRTALASDRLSTHFWPSVQDASGREPVPPVDLFSRMRQVLTQPDADAEERMRRALAASPGLVDTHPVLRQRLEALGVTPEPPTPPTTSAAQQLLGPLSTELEQWFGERWADDIGVQWEGNFKAAERDRERLAALDARVLEADASSDEMIEYAMLLRGYRPDVDSQVWIDKVLLNQPDHALALFHRGLRRLEKDDDKGVDDLQRVMDKDPDSRQAVLERLWAYYNRRGEAEREQACRAQLDALLAGQEALHQARNQVLISDKYLPHGLTVEQVMAITDVLDGLGTVGELWLVRKQLPGDDRNQPTHFVGYATWLGGDWISDGDNRLQALVDALPVPGSLVIVTGQYGDGARARIVKVAAQPLYRSSLR